MTEKELLHVMQNVNEKYSDEVQKRIDAAQKPVYRRMMPVLLAAGAAACVALTVITALPKQTERMNVASCDLTEEVAEVQISEPETDASAMNEKELPRESAAEKQAQKSAVEVTEKEKADAAQERTAESAEPAKSTEQPAAQTAETKPAAQETAQTTTAAAPDEAQLPIIGDFDLDGKFTLADGVLCNLIHFAQRNDVLDQISLTDAQRRQADLIPDCVCNDDPSLPLGYDEYHAILVTLHLIYSYDLTGITPLDYLANQNYYDDYVLYRSPRLVRSLPIDWASIGLTGDFTEDDFWRVVSPDYALERYEEENGPLRTDNDEISDFLNAVRVTQSKYLEMVNAVPEKWMPQIVEYGVAGEFCIRYTAKLHREKFGTPGYEPVYEEPVDPALIFSDDVLTPEILRKILADAKTWTIDTAPDPRF